MSFDYKVSASTTKCLFEMQEGKLKREAKRMERYHKTPTGFLDKKLKKLMNIADSKMQNLPPLDIPTLMSNPTIEKVIKMAQDEKTQQAVMDGVKKAGKIGSKIQQGV